MKKPKMKTFKDSVHGYIEIPQDYVENIIDTELFQRLRNIEQTGMRCLYPAARHDRFIHSLGTFYLGHKAFEAFRENAEYKILNSKNESLNLGKKPEEVDKFWDKCGVLFEIACLLHDIGHAPFSHTFEFYYQYEKMDSKEGSLEDKLKEQLGWSEEFTKDFEGQGSEHERMSALIACAEYEETVKRILQERDFEENDEFNEMEFIARMIIGCEYKNLSSVNQIRNCFINLLNSSSIDVDSLDYIIRDSKQSGIENMVVDVERLLNSLTIVEATHFEKAVFNNVQVHANILEGILESGKNKALISGDCKGTLNCDGGVYDSRVSGIVDLSGHMKTQNTVKVYDYGVKNPKVTINGADFSEMPKTQGNVDIFANFTDDLKFTGNDLKFQKRFNGNVQLKADKITMTGTYIEGNLTGDFTGDILGDYSRIRGSLVQWKLGFHKSSLSIIENVLIARNYEYQWIYSHHKVVYYANYLLIQLLRTCVKHCLEKKEKDVGLKNVDEILAAILSWKTMLSSEKSYIELDGQYFYRPTDADLLSLFKKCQIDYIKNETMDECQTLLKEYYTRKYKKSLWKSSAEFEIFFGNFSAEEKEKLFNLIMTKSRNGIGDRFGYFSKEWENKLEQLGMKNVVWVNGTSKMKELKEDETYIAFKDEVYSLKTVSIGKQREDTTLRLFYLYYEPTTKEIERREIRKFFKEELKKFLEK